jgi:hypothetical protein
MLLASLPVAHAVIVPGKRAFLFVQRWVYLQDVFIVIEVTIVIHVDKVSQPARSSSSDSQTTASLSAQPSAASLRMHTVTRLLRPTASDLADMNVLSKSVAAADMRLFCTCVRNIGMAMTNSALAIASTAINSIKV